MKKFVLHGFLMLAFVGILGMFVPLSFQAARAQERCTYVFGFRAYHALHPEIGSCVAGEYADAQGDTWQQTQQGMLFWAKEENTVAFIDGASSEATFSQDPRVILAVGLICRWDTQECAAAQTVRMEPSSSIRNGTYRTVGEYINATRTVYYDPNILIFHHPLMSGAGEIAVVLAHELEHVVQFDAGLPYKDWTSCVAAEQDAVRRQIDFWNWLWQGDPPSVAYNNSEFAIEMLAKGAAGALVTPECAAIFGNQNQ